MPGTHTHTRTCREIKLQSELGEGHQNIIAPEEVVLTSHYLGLVMEFAAGGSLTSYITQRFRECRWVRGSQCVCSLHVTLFAIVYGT